VVYSLEFHPGGLAEFRALDNSVRSVMVKRLEERLNGPQVIADRLSGPLSNCYKIRLGKTGHRLVYQVIEEEQILFVIAVGKRADKAVYRSATKRI
jgi:mRNA interferase RelE/StbE